MSSLRALWTSPLDNSSATLTVTVNTGLANGTVAQGWLSLTGGGDEYQVAYWAQVAP